MQWNVRVGVNVDVQSVQESLTELTAVCESWWGEAGATALNECVLPSAPRLRRSRRGSTHTNTHRHTQHELYRNISNKKNAKYHLIDKKEFFEKELNHNYKHGGESH